MSAADVLTNLAERQQTLSNRAAWLAGFNDGMAAVHRPTGMALGTTRRCNYERGYDDGSAERGRIGAMR